MDIFRCRECNGDIPITTELDSDEIRVLHTKCYTKMLRWAKESSEKSGVTIAIKEYGKKKRLPKVNRTLGGGVIE